MKLLLSAFEQIHGLNTNFYKSELFCFVGNGQDSLDQYMALFGCNNRNLPLRYLEIPIHYWILHNPKYKMAEDRFKKHLSSWKGKHLAVWKTDIDELHVKQTTNIPKGFLKKLDYFCSRFYWQQDKNKIKILDLLGGTSNSNLNIRGILESTL
ncbi:hypothetical protein U9M48_035108 [Paspalum notatum var. saurae]|uniref:Uncharacterized protein n=1 Tax=Paspalum notatum var. saurae TaxID=547442 RepID=A0AAQ3UAK9_PASNO